MYTYEPSTWSGFRILCNGVFDGWVASEQMAKDHCQWLNNRIESLPGQIKLLKDLESKANQGRGISCVRTVIQYLEGGKLDQAKVCCLSEHDKIRNYPEIVGLLYVILPEYRKMLIFP